LSSIAAPFFCEDIATPCAKRTPCSRGELISSRAMADNNGIAADPFFRCGAKKRHGRHSRAALGSAARSVCARPRRRLRARSLRARRSFRGALLAPSRPIAAYFGICTSSSSSFALSGWLKYLNLTASDIRSLSPTTRSGITISLGSNSSRTRRASSMPILANSA